MPDKFDDCVTAISSWLSNIVDMNGQTPKIFFNGDFNFPTMESWNDRVITNFIDIMINSYDKGKLLSVTNNQIKTLYECTETWLLTQKICENTRNNHILDLFFTNDENSILDS